MENIFDILEESEKFTMGKPYRTIRNKCKITFNSTDDSITIVEIPSETNGFTELSICTLSLESLILFEYPEVTRFVYREGYCDQAVYYFNNIEKDDNYTKLLIEKNL